MSIVSKLISIKRILNWLQNGGTSTPTTYTKLESLLSDAADAVEAGLGTKHLAAGGITGASLAPSAYRSVTVYSVGALSAGHLLHISGYDATSRCVIVEKADNDASKPAQLIAAAANAGTTTSEARDIYTLTAQNTNTATVGDPVYLSATAGGWTLTPPTAANERSQIVGRVTVKSATVGEILFDLARAELVSVETGGIQDLAVTGAKLNSNVPGAGLALSSSQLIPDIHGLGAAAAVVAAEDYLAISDESVAGDPTGTVSIDAFLTAAIGAGLTQDGTSKKVLPNIHGLPAAAAFDVATDLLAISDESVAGDPTGSVSAIDLVAGIVGAGLTQNGATKVIDIATGGVTAAMLANNAGWAAIYTAGLGASAAYVKTDAGVKTLATGTAGTKKVMFVATVTEAFADAGGNQTTFKVGEVGTDDKFAAAALFTDAILGKVFVFCGELTASTNLIVTVAAAVGAGTGGLSISAMILPAAP
jgi:hypothetical protein